ncbi:hem-containing dehydratase protein [Naviculisporaceae sp. PSN 640]
MESSIAPHLRCPRTISSHLPSPSFEPPYPSFSIRFPQDVSQLVFAIIGTQLKPGSSESAISDSRLTISSFLAPPTTPATWTAPPFHEWASVTDNRGYLNLCALVYWDSKSSYQFWTTASGFKAWWESLNPDDENSPGWFLEVLSPTTNRFETLFNTDTESSREGSAHMPGASMSAAVQEHGYWGSMRDRLPLSQTDYLSGTKKSTLPPASDSNTTKGKRVIVPGLKNLAIIRSGHDWSHTTPEERKLYLEEMHPVLEKGMDFLRDNGEEVGCYSCRFMEIVDATTSRADSIDRTFGLAYFDELASLEGWSKEHPTHLAIFGGFFQYAKKLGNNVTLRVFHEVMVLDEDQQYFEYVGCHDGTGMLAVFGKGRKEAELSSRGIN